ncbi:hypothetical protein DY000_02013827 [Brassica cretica]|uniref:40S ribosomal protein S25 n=1 Tax=Brassica cretica TaxID=69181 RepID=A0ABQ7DAN8_BRACR|nr:hypothetical protein DY000_02013827 [Brassica cretica]
MNGTLLPLVSMAICVTNTLQVLMIGLLQEEVVSGWLLWQVSLINGSLAREVIRDLMAKGTIRMVSMHSSQQI